MVFSCLGSVDPQHSPAPGSERSVRTLRTRREAEPTFAVENQSHVGEHLVRPLLTGEEIQARIGPGCTSFASPPVLAEVMVFEDYRLLMSHVFNIRHPKNTIILPELIVVLRQELVRQLVAAFCWHPSGAPWYWQRDTGRCTKLTSGYLLTNSYNITKRKRNK